MVAVLEDEEEEDKLDVGGEANTDVDVPDASVDVMAEVLLEKNQDISISRTEKAGCSC